MEEWEREREKRKLNQAKLNWNGINERKAPWIGIIADIIIPVPTTSRYLYNEEFPGVLEVYKLEGISLSWQPARYVHEIKGKNEIGAKKGTVE